MSATLQPRDPFAVDTEAAQEALSLEWGEIFDVGWDGLRWHARRRGGGDVLSGLSPDDIAVAMRAGWAAAGAP